MVRGKLSLAPITPK